jgi:hypothetical protein
VDWKRATLHQIATRDDIERVFRCLSVQMHRRHCKRRDDRRKVKSKKEFFIEYGKVYAACPAGQHT